MHFTDNLLHQSFVIFEAIAVLFLQKMPRLDTKPSYPNAQLVFCSLLKYKILHKEIKHEHLTHIVVCKFMSRTITFIIFSGILLYSLNGFSQKANTVELHIQVYDNGLCIPMIKSNNYNMLRVP